MKRTSRNETGSTLVVTIVVVATLLVLLGVAVDYSTQVSRVTQRSRRTALAMEIADGHLETLFTNWRNIYRSTWVTYGLATGGTDYSVCGTNFFATTLSSPNPLATPLPAMVPAATPPVIPTPNPSNFSTEVNYQLTQYRIQAVDPMVDLDANEKALVESGSKGGGNFVPLAANSPPPGAYGPNAVSLYGTTTYFPYSYYYLAAADVKVPALNGDVTAKVRRVFEKKFDIPWAYAMFYVDDLELQPTTPLTLTGPVHTNGSLYIGTSNLVIANPIYGEPTPNPTSGRVEYGTDYVNGYSPKDPRYPGSNFSKPTFAKSDSSLALSDSPPAQVAPYLPFGWNLTLNSGNTGGNDDGYHEIIERPVAAADPLQNVRYYSQSGYQVVINANTTLTGDGTYTVTRVDIPTSPTPSPTPQTVTGNPLTTLVGNNGNGNSATVFVQGKALFDRRENGTGNGSGIPPFSSGSTPTPSPTNPQWNGAVKVTDVQIDQLVANLSSLPGWTGVLYLSDKGAATYNADGTVKNPGTLASVTIGPTGSTTTYTTTRRAFRLKNAAVLPNPTPSSGSPAARPGLTIISENPIYIQGDYNTGGTFNTTTKTYNTPSDNGTYTDPDVSTYTRRPAAIIADAITVLSGAWDDTKSNTALATSRVATNTTVNAALVSGNVPSNGARYSGGGENFIRLLEDWSTHTLCYYGSMVQLYASNQGIGPWTADASVYAAPQTSKWYYDYSTLADGSPPGNLQIAAYLQQQRWYQVY